MALPLQAETGIKGAVCIIKADNRLVMVDEILTQRSSLPAGTIDGVETPQETAQREAWEETGLVVTVGDELARNEKAVFYDCISDSDIIAFSRQDNQGSHPLPIWFAPHYGVETSAARLIAPESVDVSAYRYPQQWNTVVDAFQQATNQSVKYADNLVEAAPSFNRVELSWLMTLQMSVNQLPSNLASFVDTVIFAGLELTSPWLLIVVMPIVYAQFGRAFSLKLMFTISVAMIMALVAQQGVQLPAPHVYLSSLNQSAQSGFSLPNVTLAIWVVVFTVLKQKLNWGWGRNTGLSLLLILWLSVAEFYSGSAFLVDLIAGGVLGWLCAWHIVRVEQDPKVNFSLTESKGAWALLVLVGGIVLMLWPTPTFLYLAATLTSLFFASRLIPNEHTLQKGRLIVTLAVLLLVNLLFSLLHGYTSDSNMHSLILEALRWPVIVLLFCALIMVKNGQGLRSNASN